MSQKERKTAVITGASRGIGAATARRLTDDGFEVVLGARRLDEIEKIAADCGGIARALDVTDADSVDSFVAGIDRAHVLINNAGLAIGTEQIEEHNEDHVRTMWETNVIGLLRMTRGLIPLLEASGDGHIVNIGSTAGRWAYKGGAGYTISKHAVRVITETLRIELAGRPVRVSEIAPGMVETDFSIVRFGGDEAAAAKVYEGMTPLTADDIADAISWVVTRPSRVNIDEMVIKPRDQVAPWLIARDKKD